MRRNACAIEWRLEKSCSLPLEHRTAREVVVVAAAVAVVVVIVVMMVVMVVSAAVGMVVVVVPVISLQLHTKHPALFTRLTGSLPGLHRHVRG